ncbi:PPE domain-containing protein [Qaidamihabitans albus]|uniref:PPE domain-containing protein n=1 Tax=Qaidamihabitans albus TaxID=2795733 RepID=UPI0018F1A5F4|nr:PPE domain-containing protein [Qaidamihabitans albus]
MPFFLLPIVAAAATYGAATQDEAGDYAAEGGDRRIDAYQIWERITTGEGPGSLSEGQASAGRLKAAYQRRVDQIAELNRMMDRAWQGDGADAAKSGAHPLKTWMEDSHVKLQDSDRYLGEQTAAFGSVHAKVQPIPQEPPKSSFLNDITPWETDTDRAIKDYNTRAQANVDAFNEYFQASGANGKGMPNYSALDREIDDVEVDDGGDRGDNGDERPGDDRGGTPSTPIGPGGSGHPPGSVPGVSGVPGGPGTPGGPDTPLAPGTVPGGPGSPGGPSGPGNVDFPPPGNLPGGDGRDDGDGNRPGHMPGGGFRPGEWDERTNTSGFTPSRVPSADFGGGGGSVPGGGAGGFGPGGSAGGGSGAGGFAGGAAGFGPGAGAQAPGAGTGAAAPGPRGGGGMGGAAAGAAGAAGRGMGGGMMGGMGGAGRGGGKGSDDEEHQSKFLVEEDPNSLFGSDELTAPPVIGE